jgi:glycine dehydrogenase
MRKMPGRLIGVSARHAGDTALRMALQTREQHIRRERQRATSAPRRCCWPSWPECTRVWHGPEGLRKIATRVHVATTALARSLETLGHDVGDGPWFDTLRVKLGSGAKQQGVLDAAAAKRINLRAFADGTVGVTLDETVTPADLKDLLDAFAAGTGKTAAVQGAASGAMSSPATNLGAFARTEPYMQQQVFSMYHAEHEMLRYLWRLQGKDLSLVHSMIRSGRAP